MKPSRNIAKLKTKLRDINWKFQCEADRDRKERQYDEACNEMLGPNRIDGWYSFGYGWFLYSKDNCIAVIRPSIADRSIKQYNHPSDYFRKSRIAKCETRGLI